MLETLAAPYYQNIIVCMPQDLKNLFVYWNLRKERVETLNSFVSEIKPGLSPTLRLSKQYHEDEFPQPEKEVALFQIGSGNYYFREIDPNATYYIELGAKAPDGHFILFFQSPSISLRPKLGETKVEPIVLEMEMVEMNHLLRETLSSFS